MKLPPRIGRNPLELPAQTRQMTIVGANGSGKTMFTQWLADSLSPCIFRMSALEALFVSTPASASDKGSGSPVTIDTIYSEASQSRTFLRSQADTMLERLMVLLLNEEIEKLVEYKVAVATGKQVKLEASRLDMLIEHWQKLFPDSHVLRHGGQLQFLRSGDTRAYSQRKLSQGEKAVLFYFGAVMFAPADATIFVEDPELFLHASLLRRVWDGVESMRPDCSFVYTTHDVDFAATRINSPVIWVKSYSADSREWDYDILPKTDVLPEEVYMALIGSRRPVLFIEGDSIHSIDAKLYPLVFTDYTVKSMGSCNKVIESTRSFNDLKAFHHLESRGIVDRDRRDAKEVEYLRGKKIYVPEVAEIENILMLEDVVKAVASYRRKNPEKVFGSVRRSVINQFSQDLRQQALLHTRHRVKRLMEYRADGRFTNINALEEHLRQLTDLIRPRQTYENLCREFSRYVRDNDYASILRVFNKKAMVTRSNVGPMCGLAASEDAYVNAVLQILRSNAPQATQIRRAIIRCFGLDNELPVSEPDKKGFSPKFKS